MLATATEQRRLRATVWLKIEAQYPWRARVHNKPLWLALICHPFRVRYRDGAIYLKETFK